MCFVKTYVIDTLKVRAMGVFQKLSAMDAWSLAYCVQVGFDCSEKIWSVIGETQQSVVDRLTQAHSGSTGPLD